jgi:biopolymer transport protein ExbB
MFDLMMMGGPFMFATLAVGWLALSIFVRRVWFLWGRGACRQDLVPQVISLIETNDIPAALRLCGADMSPLGQLLKAALQRANRSEKEIRRAVEGAALQQLPRLKGSTIYLPQLSNLATLCGLIGTIHGLIISFQGASSAGAASRQAALSRGISIAFYNTYFGLAVATVSVVLYLLLLRRTNSTLTLLEQSAADAIDSILWFRDASRRS